MVLSDSLQYTYSGTRGGDLTTPDVPFDRSYDWGLDVFNALERQSGQARTYDAADHALTDSSIVLNVPDPFVTGYLRWTYDVQGRPATQVGFQGADSVGFNSYTYTPTGKPAENFRSQLLGGTWLRMSDWKSIAPRLTPINASRMFGASLRRWAARMPLSSTMTLTLMKRLWV